MEPVTQALLGAAVGQLGWRHRLGRRALFWGALVGMLSAVDLLSALHKMVGNDKTESKPRNK